MREFILMKASKFSDCGMTRPEVVKNQSNNKEISLLF